MSAPHDAEALTRAMLGATSKTIAPGPRTYNGSLRWTAEEDAALRRLYPRKSSRAQLRALLPHRTRRAMCERARALGLCVAGRRWTADDDAYLAREWGDVGLKTLKAKLRRSSVAIYRRAITLGLAAATQGHPSLDEVARRMGYTRPALRKILAAEGVVIRHQLGAQAPEERRCPMWTVDMDEAQEAVERHLARTADVVPSTASAAALGAPLWKVREALRRAGYAAGKGVSRATMAQTREALALYEAAGELRANRRREAGRLSARAHAERCGVSCPTMLRVIEWAGLAPQKRVGVPTVLTVEDVDRALAAYRAADGRTRRAA